MSTKHAANTGASPPTKKAKSDKKTPHDQFFDELQAVQDKNNAIGQLLVRGLPSEDEEDEENEDTSKLTMEEMKSLRFILITQERADALEEMDKLILGDQHGSSFMMFNTSFSYHVLESYDILKAKLSKTKSWSKKFNLLLGYTHAINQFDVWMHDHECGWGGDSFLKDLAKCWKAALKKSNEELGIDAEFTRPAVICFLEKFKDTVESIETYEDPAITFKFK